MLLGIKLFKFIKLYAFKYKKVKCLSDGIKGKHYPF